MGYKLFKLDTGLHFQTFWPETRPKEDSSRMAEQHDVSGMEKRCKGVAFFSKPEPFYLKWLSGSRVTTCYGCGKKIRAGIHDPVPPDPYNVVTTRKQICAYTPRGSVGLRFSFKPENKFFHLRNFCTAKCSDLSIKKVS